MILRASYATKWNQSRTAELLQLKRDKLRYRMKLYDLHPTKATPATPSRTETVHVTRDDARRRSSPRGCARRLVRATRTSTALLPSHLKTVAIPVFENEHHRVHARAGGHRRGDRALRRATTTARWWTSARPNAVIRGKVTSTATRCSASRPAARRRSTASRSASRWCSRTRSRTARCGTTTNLVKTANYYVQDVPGQTARDRARWAQAKPSSKIADEILSRTVESW